MLLNVLPGQDLLSWAWDAPPEDVNHAIELVLQGIDRLHEMTEPLNQELLAQQLPHRTLLMELQRVLDDGGPWLNELIVAQAIERLLPIVQSIQTPLAFSSGDYNQGNFLFDGDTLTGFIDFTGACFEDPHIGMAMYWIYSWYPLDKAGIIEHYLKQQHLSFADFAPRLAIRCLRTLQQQIAVTGGEDIRDEDDFESHADYRNRITGYLERAIQAMS